MQQCTSCKLNKSFDQFYFDKRYNKHHKQCRPCLAFKKKQKRQNDVKVQAYLKTYRKKRRLHYNHYMNMYRKKYPEKIHEYQRQYYHVNGGNVKKRIYDKKNRKKQQAWANKKYKIDDQFRLKKCLRTRINKMIHKEHKYHNSVELLGCDMEFYKEYLSFQFESEMSWDNYGTYWNIDHVKPCAMFDLTKTSEQQICFHWTNTRPCIVSENFSKSDSIDEQLIKNQEKIVNDFLTLKSSTKI